jgi:L-threonylcarbamoyladenylate synthase
MSTITPKALNTEQATEALQKGEVIAYPTEAVWGLGCDPFNPEAVKQLLALKQRPVEKGLILVVSSFEQLQPILASTLTEQQLQLLQAPCLTPTTWLVPFNEHLPRWVSGEHTTVAVRISQHPTVQVLCNAFGGAIISTSANTAGAQPAKEAFQVRRYFGQQVQVCQGRIGQATQPSTIIDLHSGKIIRE